MNVHQKTQRLPPLRFSFCLCLASIAIILPARQPGADAIGNYTKNDRK